MASTGSAELTAHCGYYAVSGGNAMIFVAKRCAGVMLHVFAAGLRAGDTDSASRVKPCSFGASNGSRASRPLFRADGVLLCP